MTLNPADSRLQVLVVEVPVDAHARFGGGGAVGVVVVEGFGFGDVDIVVQVGVFFVGLPVAVRRLVVVEQAEGALRVALLEPVEAEVGELLGWRGLDL